PGFSGVTSVAQRIGLDRRQARGDARAGADAALDGEAAAGLGSNRPARRETESSTVFLGRKERRLDLGQRLGGHPDTVVGDGDRAAVWKGVAAVAHQVEQQTLEIALAALHGCQLIRQLGTHANLETAE